VLRLLDFTLNSTNIFENNVLKCDSLFNPNVVHPVCLPFISCSSSTPPVLLLLEYLFTKHDCGCVISSASNFSNEKINQHKHQSIVSLLYNYYISSFKLSFNNVKNGDENKTFPDMNSELSNRPIMACLISRILHRLRFLVCYYYGGVEKKNEEKGKRKSNKNLLEEYLEQIGVDVEPKKSEDSTTSIIISSEKENEVKMKMKKKHQEIQEEMKRKQKMFMEKFLLEEDDEDLNEDNELKGVSLFFTLF
jgi:hypothetical protein